MSAEDKPKSLAKFADLKLDCSPEARDAIVSIAREWVKENPVYAPVENLSQNALEGLAKQKATFDRLLGEDED